MKAKRRVTVSIATLMSISVQAQTGSRPASCVEGKWTSPVALVTAKGQPVYVEPGSAAQLGDRMMVLGAPTFIWAARDVFFPDDSATVLRDSAAYQLSIRSFNAGQPGCD